MLPTGLGKSMCCIALPLIFDELRELSSPKSIVIVISPLVSLMKDQVKKYGLKCASIGENVDESEGQYQQSRSLTQYKLLEGHVGINCVPKTFGSSHS